MKKLISSLLCTFLLLGLAACGGGGDSTSQQQPPPSTASSGSQTASSVSIPEPVVLNQAFLTGLEKDASYPEGQRICAVMLNNYPKGWPQHGISEAQMIVEIKVEGGITRLMAVFEDYKSMPKVGPVRSARDQYFRWLLPYWGFYVHDAQSAITKMMFGVWDYEDFNLDTGKYGGSTKDPDNLNSLAWRDQDRKNAGYATEYTEFTDGRHIEATVLNNGLDDYRSYGSPIFNFVPYTEPAVVPGGGSATDIAVIHSASFRTFFEYDPSTEKYMMSRFNSSKGGVEPAIDGNNGAQVGFDNVIVAFAPMKLYPGGTDGLVEVTYDFGGAVFYISKGGFEMGLWRKGPDNQAFVLNRLDANGNETGEMIDVNTGTTYLAIVDDANAEAFREILESGDTSSAETGDVNPDGNDVE